MERFSLLNTKKKYLEQSKKIRWNLILNGAILNYLWTQLGDLRAIYFLYFSARFQVERNVLGALLLQSKSYKHEKKYLGQGINSENKWVYI